MALTFKFTDRWQTSLRSLFNNNPDNEIPLGLLEHRDAQLEQWMAIHVGTANFRFDATSQLTTTGDFTPGDIAYVAADSNYYRWTGTAWTMHMGSGTYTPTLVNMAVGTGGSALNTASWSYARKLLTIEGILVFGTTGTTFPSAAAETIGLPTGFTLDGNASTQVGMVTHTIGGSASIGSVRIESSTTLRPLSFSTAAASVQAVDLTATVPGSWAAGDSMRYSISTLASY